MNMISTGAFLNEMDASKEQPTVAEKFAAVWEKKNAKAARAGGVSLMALSLAACGGSSSNTTTTDTTTTPVTDDAVSTALTKGVDALKGGSGNDSFSGQAGDTNATIVAGDSIDGGAGSDTFTLATNGTATTVAGLTLTDVETVRISDSASTSSTVNLFGSTGITDIETYASTGAALSVTNVGAIADLNLTNTSGTGTVTLSYAADAVKGTDDVQNIVLSGAKATGLVTVAKVETVNVVSATAGSTLKVAAADATKMTIDADAATTIDASDAVNASMATVDMTGSTGAVTLTAPSVTKLAITGGDGADSLTINNISKDTTVVGGSGDDVVATSQTSLTQLDVASVDVETLKMTAATSTVNLKDATIGAIDYSIGSGSSTLSGVASGFDVSVKATSTSLGVTLSDATGSDDTLDLALGKSGTSGTDGIAAGTLTATGIESVNINSVGDVKTTGLINGTGVNTLTIAGTSVKTVDVDGERDFTLTQAGGSIETYDASDATGTQDTSNIVFKTTGATVKGGSDKDTLTGTGSADTIHGNGGVDTITGGAGNDTIDGGDGADKITGGTGGDTITGGAGADIFTVADGDSITNFVDVYKDFTTGEDRFVLGQSATKFVGNVATVADGVAAMTGDAQAFFVTATNTLYIIATKSSGYQAGSDDIIKLEGVTALTEADIGLGSQGAGNSITLIASSAEVSKTASTNASAKTTDKDDTITTSFANLSSTTIDGALGEDTLTMTTAITGSTDISGVTTSIEKLNLATDGTTSNDVAGVEASTVTLGDNGDTVAVASGVTALTLTGGAKADIITAAGAKSGSITTGEGNDAVTLQATASFEAMTVSLGAGDDSVEFDEGSTIDVASGKVMNLLFGTGTADELKITGSGGTIDLTASNLVINGLDKLSGAANAQTVTLDAADIASLSTIDMGAGTDILKLSGASTFDLDGSVTMSNTEKFTLETAGATLKIAAGDVTSATDDIVVGATVADATGGTLVITDATAVDLTGSSNGGAVKNIGTLQFQNAKATLAVANIFDGTNDADEGFHVITGGGGSGSEIYFNNEDNPLDLTNVAITGVKKISIEADNGSDESFTLDAADLADVTSFVLTDDSGSATTDNNLILKDSGDLSSVVFSNVDSKFDSFIFNNADAAGTTTTIDASLIGIMHSSYTLDGSGGATNESSLVIKNGSSDLSLTAATTTDITKITIDDATGSQKYTLDDDNTAEAITVNLNGGSDSFDVTVVTSDGTTDATMVADVVTVTGFKAGLVGDATKITLTTDTTDVANFASLTSATDISGDTTQTKVYELAGTLSDLGDFTAVQTLINNLVSVAVNNDEYSFIAYGTYNGVANSAAIYNAVFDSTAGATDAIDMVMVLSGGITADSLDAANFI